MKLCMIGSGYVGLVSGVCFSDLGNDVICVDNDLKKIDALTRGIITIYEPGLEELVIKNIIFICVGTPTKKNASSADLSYVYNVAKEIALSINKFKIIITKSTVPVTTGDEIEKLISKRVSKNLFSVASNPEFLREGEAIRDFTYPDRIVIGTEDSRTNKILKELYAPLISKGAQYIQTARRTAELIKYASNAFLATKITFINEIANLCEKINVNVEDVAIAMGLDKRIGSRFLRAGPAYGGSCFPKDTKAIVATANQYKTNLSVIKSVIKSNENRNKFLLKRVNFILKNKIKNKRITFLGVTFKANTDDMRDSSSLTMIPELIKQGAKIKYYDPTGYKETFKKYKNVSYAKTIERAVDSADLIIIHTEWNDFKSINFNKTINKKKTKIFDMRNIYSSIKMKKNGIKYFGIGK
ncbi:MAG: UDP-glucose/GDP-mannose dehydrogenase family protein [Pelagibacteraceae bacterium]